MKYAQCFDLFCCGYMHNVLICFMWLYAQCFDLFCWGYMHNVLICFVVVICTMFWFVLLWLYAQCFDLFCWGYMHNVLICFVVVICTMFWFVLLWLYAHCFDLFCCSYIIVLCENWNVTMLKIYSIFSIFHAPAWIYNFNTLLLLTPLKQWDLLSKKWSDLCSKPLRLPSRGGSSAHRDGNVMKSFVFQNFTMFVSNKGPIGNKSACLAPSHYLNQCWPSSLTHICGTRGSGLMPLDL